MSRELPPVARGYIRELVIQIRNATQEASKYSQQWNDLNDEWNAWYVANFQTTIAMADPVHYTNTKKVNIPLAAAFDTWSFWQREAMRLTAALEAEKAAREMWEW